MKPLLLIIIAVLLSLSGLNNCKAQSFAPVGAEWYYGMQYGFVGGVGYEHFFVEKDSTYLGENCRKINVERYSEWGAFIKSWVFFVYDKGDSVFYSDQENFYLLYDFSLEVGDTLRVRMPKDYTMGYSDTLSSSIVDSVKYISQNGELLKHLYLSPGRTTPFFFFGIRERMGGLKYFFPFDWVAYDLLSPSFRCYSDSEISIIESQCDEYYVPNSIKAELESSIQFKKIANNHFQFILHENIQNKTLEVRICNELGQVIYAKKHTGSNIDVLIPGNLASGIYFFSLITDNKEIKTYKYFVQ